MRTIEVDDEVLNFLKKNAEAFVDTPNSVLRRLLDIGISGAANKAPIPRPAQPKDKSKSNESGVSSDAFVRKFWSKRFDGVPRQVERYRMMLESDNDIVYFQNFNKPKSPNLWFRLNPSPLNTLRSSGKQSWVCFTNPSERIGYLIPLSDIDEKAKEHRWSRPEYEVNIDVADDRWREFDWRIQSYLVNV